MKRYTKRWIIRTIIFAILFFFFWAGTGRLFYTSFPTAASPYLTLAAIVSGTVVGASVVLGLSLLFVMLFRKRFFCRWICPMGFCFDLLILCREKWIEHRPVRYASNRMKWLGGVILLASLIGLIFPYTKMGVFFQLDPLVLFGSLFQGDTKNVLRLSVLLLMFLSVLVPWFWCGNICPLGSLQAWSYNAVRIFYRRRLNCSRKEPTGDSPKETGDATSNDEKASSSRRLFITGTITAFAGGVLLIPLTGSRILLSKVKRLFLPPGAISDPFFSSLCTGCGRCIESCPTRFLKPEAGRFLRPNQPESDAPLMDCVPEAGRAGTFCEKDCNACGQVCPTGAIRPFTLEEKPLLPIATVEVDFENCQLFYQKECQICQRECPYEAIDFVWSEKEYSNVPIVDSDRCVGCRRCIVYCPGVAKLLDPDLETIPHDAKKGLVIKSVLKDI